MKKRTGGRSAGSSGLGRGGLPKPICNTSDRVNTRFGKIIPVRVGFQRRPPRREPPREPPRELPREPPERVFPADCFDEDLRLLEPTPLLPPRGEGREVGLRALGDERLVERLADGEGRRDGERWTDEVRRRSGVDGRASDPRTWALGRTSRRELEVERCGRALRSPPLFGFGCERAPVLGLPPEDLGRDRGCDDRGFADEPDFVGVFDAEGRSRV